jgi:phosphohistidine phosphatase
MMELILWRHAEAEDGHAGASDAARVLTPKGRKQAIKMGDWLDRNLPSSCRILCSPAARAVQTAEALGRKFRIHADLGMDGEPQRILQLANWPHGREPVLLVGHQPVLGRLAALLIHGAEDDWTVRKGGVWWIAQRERDGRAYAYVKAVMSPELCAK